MLVRQKVVIGPCNFSTIVIANTFPFSLLPTTICLIIQKKKEISCHKVYIIAARMNKQPLLMKS